MAGRRNAGNGIRESDLSFNAMESRLTEGARRALQLAGQLAREQGSAEIEPLHLLWALRLDESRAAEILEAHGLSQGRLEQHFALERPESEQAREEAALFGDPAAESAALRDVVVEARRHAAQGGRHAEIGSEHLLYGLSSIASPVHPLLNEHGLSAEQLERRVREQTGVSSEPIEVDFDLTATGRPESEQTDVLRILDAAANRAREGLRVIEDYVRFTLDDAHLMRLLKQCRHDLTESLRDAGVTGWVAARDTERDVGTAVSTAAERRRGSPQDVMQASVKRVQEAARSLEEFGKILSPELGERIGQVRYRLYTLEKALLTADSSQRRFAGRDLYLLLTKSLCRQDVEAVVRASLKAGVGVIQIREKSMGDREILEHARRVRQWTREAAAMLIINDRPDLAVLCDADGVHVGQEELPVREVRRIVGLDRVVGVSTHSIEQARRAVLDGADYLGVGPVFPTSTKSFDQFAGLEFVRQAASEISLSWYAIGGIDGRNISAVREAGAACAAVSSAICGAEDVETAARTLLGALRG